MQIIWQTYLPIWLKNLKSKSPMFIWLSWQQKGAHWQKLGQTDVQRRYYMPPLRAYNILKQWHSPCSTAVSFCFFLSNWNATREPWWTDITHLSTLETTNNFHKVINEICFQNCKQDQNCRYYFNKVNILYLLTLLCFSTQCHCKHLLATHDPYIKRT